MLVSCSCDGARLTTDDLIAMAHFHCVTLNMHLAYGNIRRAIQSGTGRCLHVFEFQFCVIVSKHKGKVAMQIAARLHDVKIPMKVLPLYFHAVLAIEEYVV